MESRKTRGDRERWDARYAERDFPLDRETHPWLLANEARLPAGGVALDAASGLGGNREYLIVRGFRVVECDISEIGLRKAGATASPVVASGASVASAASPPPVLERVAADLESCPFRPARFDLILCFRFRPDRIAKTLVALLRPGGLLLVSCFRRPTDLEVSRGVLAHTNPKFLASLGELPALFADLETLDHTEGVANAAAFAALAARKS